MTRAPRQTSSAGANSSTRIVLASAREARNARACSPSASSSPASPVVRERPTPVPEKQRQADDDQRDADGMTQAVQRVLVLRLVVLDERSRHTHLRKP